MSLHAFNPEYWCFDFTNTKNSGFKNPKNVCFAERFTISLVALCYFQFISNCYLAPIAFAQQQASDPTSIESKADRSWYFNGWSGPGFVLLKNGNVLQGDVVTQGNGLIVKLDDTGEISVASGEVIAVKSSLLELYEHQVSKTHRWEAGEHWHLSKWCLRYGLLDQAHLHYVQLKSMAGKHPSFKRMEAEIKAALLRDPVISEALRELRGETRNQDADSVAMASDHLKLEQATSQTPSGNDSATPQKPSKSNATWSPDTSHLVLDRYTQEYFRQQVHPFIMLKCGQAGCHGGVNQSQFQITRSGSQRSRRTSDTSLLSTVNFLVETRFDETALYSKATTSHGARTSPPLDVNNPSDRELFDRLRYWHAALHRNSAQSSATNQMANAASGVIPTPGAFPRIAATNMPGVIPASAGSPPIGVLSAQHSANNNTNRVAESKNGNPGKPSYEESPNGIPEVGTGLLALEREIAKLEEIEKSRKQRDLHDPAEFNRQFGTAP